MADVYEKNLGSKTSLTMNDFIRVVGSDNVSYKQLVSDVADKIITTYAGATLAGNAQSVKDALDGLNSDKQPKTMSKTVAGQTTVEGAISKLNSDKQPKKMSQTIGGETTVEGCLSSLNSKMTREDTTFSTASGITGSEVLLWRYGKIVYLKGYFTKSSAFGTSEFVIGTLPEGWRPYISTRTSCTTGTAAYNAKNTAYMLVMATNGNIIITCSNNTDTVAVIDLMFIQY
jgi:hypothetical protein